VPGVEPMSDEDDEPITAEYLLSIGFEYVESDMGTGYSDHLERASPVMKQTF